MTGLASRRARLDGALLHERDVLEGHLDAEVAAGDHDAVERRDDALEVVDGLRLLDLGDDGDALAELVHDRVHVDDVVGRADERQRDHVDAEAHGEAEVLAVLVGQGRDADGDTRQVDALVVADLTADDRLGEHVGVGDLDRAEHDLAVVDEQDVAGSHVSGQPVVGGPDDRVVAVDRAGRDGEALAGAQRDRTAGEATGADLGALEVDEDADGSAGRVAGGADVAVDLLVHGVVTVGEVEAGDVHAGVDEGAEPGWAMRSWVRSCRRSWRDACFNLMGAVTWVTTRVRPVGRPAASSARAPLWLRVIMSVCRVAEVATRHTPGCGGVAGCRPVVRP